jgi:TetR/AcrR family transcriptional regulator, transcriptional repressor for nem operon
MRSGTRLPGSGFKAAPSLGKGHNAPHSETASLKLYSGAIARESPERPRVGRPKAYDRDAALLAARDLFWEQGYERTSIADLEQRTGLNRSSLYQEFGSKRELFEASLECYADRIIAGLLAGLRDESGTGPRAGTGEPAGSGPPAETGLAAVAALFRQVARLLRCDEGVGARGCLMVNSIAELAARDTRVRAHARAYRDRLRADFGAALTRAAALGEISPGTVETRARLLASALMGAWLSARIDPADAGSLCESIAQEAESWRIAPARPR